LAAVASHPGTERERPADALLLPVLLTLTVVAGFLDAYSFTGTTGTFIANQTGNTVLIGVRLADGQLGDSWPPVAAVAAFLVGGMLSSLLVTGVEPPKRPARLLASELALLVGYLVVVVAAVGTHTGRATGGTLLALIVLSALAMGIQTAVIRNVRGTGVSTTFTSGMVAEVGHLMGILMIRGEQRRATEVRASIVAAAVLTYVGGAALGALSADGASWGLLAPIGAVAFVLAGVVVQNSAPR
jgi:uncharacterized membrane protein YoaK (UPF0700 family)